MRLKNWYYKVEDGWMAWSNMIRKSGNINGNQKDVMWSYKGLKRLIY